jgi:anti-sigma factor RsiW
MKFASKMKCSQIQKLMSPYIDSMAEPDECEQLESHLTSCEPCQRQLQTYKSLRSMIARIEPVRPPEDLVLDTRVRLSHARAGNWYDRAEIIFNNVLKPVMMPAVSGIALTVLSFGMLFGSLGLNLRGQNLPSEVAVLEQPVGMSDPSAISVVSSTVSDGSEPISVQASVGSSGKVLGYKVIGGVQTPAVIRRINDLLFPAHFSPATRNNEPIPSTLIWTIMNVRS